MMFSSFINKLLPDEKDTTNIFSSIFEEWEIEKILIYEEESLQAFTDVITLILNGLIN